MPLDPRAARFLEMMALGRSPAGARDIAERRLGLQKLMLFAKADQMAPPGRDMDIAGVPCRLYAPENAGALTPGIIFFHGGGLVAGSIDTHDVIARALCASSGCRLISVDYRLAPEHPFPAARDDALAVSRTILLNALDLGIDPKRIALAGESGGGGLAVGVAHAFQNGEFATLCLICPVLDFGAESNSRKEFAQGYLIDRELMEDDLADFLQGKTGRDDPRISPLRLDDISHLPPTIIHTAEYDPLRDEGISFGTKLNKAGIRVTHHGHAGMVHNFHALGAVIPDAKAVLHDMGVEIGEWLRNGTRPS